ncbi:Bacterial regulatory proteins, tetR family [uncultured archaeon]|nr:Bacterial regulatory proteins, tetR family [uncultured archaeon]
MSLREKKKIETKNKIFEVSGRLFKEKGFENTTIDEITKEAEIGKGTFFNYFPTKEALLLYFVEQKDELTYSLIEIETARSIPTKDKIKNLLVFLAESYETDKELTKLLIFEYIKYIRSTGLKSGEDQSRHHRLSKILHDFLEDGVKKGEVKGGIDVKIAAETLTAVYFHSVMVWLWSENDYSISEDISGMIDLVFEGIGS